MQIRKTYYNVKPELLHNELTDFITKQGVTLDENRFETLSVPTNSSSFISRSTLTFVDSASKECIRAHLVGMAIGETKLMIDTDDGLFPAEKTKAIMEDIDFIFSSYEVKPK